MIRILLVSARDCLSRGSNTVLACSASHFRGDALHGYICMRGTSVVGLCLLAPSPRFVPIPVIARDASLARIEYLPSMLATARLRITDLSQTNPLSTLLHPTVHISPPGEKRRWRRRRSRNPIHQTQPLLLHASLQVGRSVQLRL